jgi:hypothetical protein
VENPNKPRPLPIRNPISPNHHDARTPKPADARRNPNVSIATITISCSNLISSTPDL